MAKRKVIDATALIQMIKDGSSQSDIMEKFGFKNSTQLKVAYANALMESGEATVIKGAERSTKSKPVDTKVTVNGKGSLIITKAIMEKFKIEEGKTFVVRKSASGLSLKAV